MLHHIGIIANPENHDLERRYGFHSVLDLVHLVTGRTAQCIGSLEIKQWQCWCYMYNFGIASPRFEIIVPYGGKLLEWANEHPLSSLHHIALKVNDVRRRSKYCYDRGVPILEPEPVGGVCGTLVNFIHPSYCGVMVELVEDLPNV